MQTLVVATTATSARDAMRHFLALYVGGMGSRKQNFYNALVRRYGFEDAARRVQDLYLEGRKDEAAAALPGELIDAVSLCGPRDVVRERIAMFRDAGVGHADRLADGVDVRGPPRAAARGRRARGVTLPADLDVRAPGAAATSRASPRSSPRATRPTASGRRPAGSRRRPAASSTAGAGGSRTARGGRASRSSRAAASSALVCFTQAVVQRTVPARTGRHAAPAGVLTLEPIPGRAHVSAVFTHPDRWREGIAAGMLAVAEDGDARRAGYAEVQLWTPREAPARRFYEAAGWRHDGREQWLAELGLPIVAYVKSL